MNTRYHQRNSQKLIQDQHYSNQIFYGMLSTIESIVLFHQNKSHEYNNKAFKHYDRVNYSSKNLHELRSQLQSHLFIFLTSLKVFQLENPYDKWTLPQNFNQYKSEQFLKGALRQLEGRDQCSRNLIKDVVSILKGNFHNLYFETVNLSVTYSEQEKIKQRNGVFSQGLFSTQQMEERQKEAQEVQSINQLTAKISIGSTSQSVLDHGHSQQKYHQYQNQDSNISSSWHASKNNNLANSKEQRQSTEIEEEKNQAQVEEHYFIFKERHIAEQFQRKGGLYNIEKGTDYFYVENIKKLKELKGNLWNNRFYYVVPFTLDNNNQFTFRKKYNVQVPKQMKL